MTVRNHYNGSSDDVCVYDGYVYQYDKQNKISAEKAIDKDGSITDKYSYEYDKAGQLVRFNDAVADKTYTYTYDDNGNILAKTEYAYSTTTLGAPTDTITYSYDTQWKDKLTSVGDKTISYDNIGNPTEYFDAELTWEGRNLTSYKDNEYEIVYQYDENGMRYRTTITDKAANESNSLDYVWVDGKLISIMYTEAGVHKTAKYIYNDFDEPVGMILTDEETGVRRTYYYLKNAQGDITNIVSSSGSKMVEFTYDAWGKRTIHYQADVSNPNNIIRWFEQVTACALTPFGYRGYCYDMYTDLYYLQSRYYDPNTGRFINADDTNYLNATGTVLGCNLFAYCENDGVNRVDYNGCYGIRDLLDIFNDSLTIVQKVIEMIGNTCAKEVKKLKNSVKILFNKPKNQMKLLNKVVKESDELAKKFGSIGLAVTFVTILVGFVNSIKKGMKIIFAVFKVFAEICTEVITHFASKICGSIAKKVPAVGFILDILVSLGVSYLLSRYFTDARVTKIAKSIYFSVKNRKTMNSKTLFKIVLRSVFA